MQEEITQRTMAIIIRGTEFSASTLQRSVKAVVRRMHSSVQNRQAAEHKGKQSLKSLQKENAALETVELNQKNLGGFERIAKKYGIQYSLMKDKTSSEPQYILFFKGKDASVMETAFQEYAYKKHGIRDRESLRDLLKKIQEHPEQYQNRTMTKQHKKTRSKQKVKAREVTR